MVGRGWFTAGLLVLVLCCGAQDKKYEGLLWQITGKGMAKPSYLYGTMHVSSKLVFHLGDPFFDAISNVDEVALELNPDTWLDEFVNSDNFQNTYSTNFYTRDYNYNDPFEKTLEIKRKQKEYFKAELAEDPVIINSFMFRSDKSKADFEEDTYLDLYIYQTAKKLGKKVFGIETVAALDRNNDMANRAKAHEDNSIKSGKNSYAYAQGEKLEEAYRRGDLDELDSLNQLLSTDSLREYIVYKRNVIMANRMAEAMKDHALFTGVGAAHLPGDRGVIELLRSKGYTVKAIDKGEIDAERKEKLDNKIVQRPFARFTTPDSMFSVEVPDKMFCFTENSVEQVFLCADLINGIYFTASRVKSYAAVTHYSAEKMEKIVDSLVYENVPGKIIERKNIEKNGLPGFYILNKTRKGDFEAYNILFAPDEVLIFKARGTNENVKSEYGMRYLSSIELNLKKEAGWKTYTAQNNSFSVMLPAKPLDYVQYTRPYSGNKVDMLAQDTKTGNTYLLIRTNLSNPDYFEEDTFELSIMAEDFRVKNDYVEKHRSFTTYAGRKAIRAQFTTRDSQSVAAMFVAQNLNFYTLAVFYTTDSSMNETFFNSLQMRNPEYKDFRPYYDSVLHFSVSLPYRHLVPAAMKTFGYGSLNTNPAKYLAKTETFTPPAGFETVEVSYYRYCPYVQVEDTAIFIKRRRKYASASGDYIVKRQTSSLKDGILTIDFLLGDTNSSRQLHERAIVKNGERYIISAYADTIFGESRYVQTFFESFKPGDTVVGLNLFKDHSHLFLADILSADSLTRVHAIEETSEAEFNNNSAPALMASFGKIPDCVSYIDIKTELYKCFRGVKGKQVLPFLEKAYKDAGDTSAYQFAILYALAKMKTPEAMAMYGKLLIGEPPLSDNKNDVYTVFEPLYDSLKLSKTLFPALLDLVPIDEYKNDVYSLLVNMLDSNDVTPAVYKSFKGVILTQAKLELKREMGTIKAPNSEKDNNYKLQNFAALLVPYYKETPVKEYFDRLMKTDNLTVKSYVAIRLEKSKVQVPDTLWSELAKDEKYRVWLHGLMRRNNLLGRFPEQYLTQKSFNESILRGFIPSETNTLDSLVMLLNVPGNYRGETGKVYLYKYKVKKDKDWKLALLGLMPEDDKKVSDKYELYDIKSEYVDNHKTPAEQLRELVFKERKRKKGS